MKRLSRSLLLAVSIASSSTASAERRLNSLSGIWSADLNADHRGRVLLGATTGLRAQPTLDPQVRYFLLDRVTIGSRLRIVFNGPDVLELDAGYAVSIGDGRLLGADVRNDLVAFGGVGTTRELTGLAFAGLALRASLRTRSTLMNMLTIELGARTSRAIAPAQLTVNEVTLGALVMFPPVRRVRSCFGPRWK